MSTLFDRVDATSILEQAHSRLEQALDRLEAAATAKAEALTRARESSANEVDTLKSENAALRDAGNVMKRRLDKAIERLALVLEE